MNAKRQTGRAGSDYDKKFDFMRPAAPASPDHHRHIPADAEVVETRRTPHPSEDFGPSDFKARWWPAPDVD